MRTNYKKRETHIKLGKFIQKARLEQKLTQLLLAEACSCNVKFIGAIEQGRAGLPWIMSEPLSKILKINHFELNFKILASRLDLKVDRNISKAVKLMSDSHDLQAILKSYSEASPASKARFVQGALELLVDEKVNL